MGVWVGLSWRYFEDFRFPVPCAFGTCCSGVWRRESGCLGGWGFGLRRERVGVSKSYTLEFNRRFGQAGFGDSTRHAIGVGVVRCDALGGNLVRTIFPILEQF